MASCSLATLQASACANGFLDLTKKQAEAVLLQLISTIGGNTLTLEQLREAACSSGFLSLSEKQARTLLLQGFCNLSEGLKQDVVGCVNLIPDGTTYNDLGGYNLNGLIIGATYYITFGNDPDLISCGVDNIVNTGAGTTFIFVASDTTATFSYSVVNAPITATICKV